MLCRDLKAAEIYELQKFISCKDLYLIGIHTGYEFNGEVIFNGVLKKNSNWGRIFYGRIRKGISGGR